MKELAGNPGHRPLNDSEPRPESGMPEKPKGMGKAANREWDFMAPELLRLGLLSKIDGKALAAYCDAYSLWEQARKDINKYGLVVKTPKCDKLGNVIVVQGLGDADPDDAEVVMNSAQQTGRVLYELKANPAVSIYNTMGKLMKSYLIEFGLTPASRSKLKIDKKPEEQDPMARLLSGKGAEEVKQAAPLHFDTGGPIVVKPGMPDVSQISEDAVSFDA